ncbi:hypothetical protein HOLleu_29909 [Holothuria leucospilota]|uniref:Uncharacterized protein n=1 Tax=Holothuria leucospilota TaxID=206669 RepID=A0A9Q1GY18_HOLLE|nr:hypothetical protein HOLleu_29909 [Holothuria leucospilota]
MVCCTCMWLSSVLRAKKKFQIDVLLLLLVKLFNICAFFYVNMSLFFLSVMVTVHSFCSLKKSLQQADVCDKDPYITL